MEKIMADKLEPRERIAKRVRAAMKRLGWSQAELSRRSGLTPVDVSRCARGDHLLGYEKLDAIAKAIGTTVEKLRR